MPSTFTPNEGIVHEWITSIEVTNIRIFEFIGRITRLSTSRSRNLFKSKFSWGTIYESNSIFLKSEYSYFQYHWLPIDFKVNEGSIISSKRYNNRRDGRAIKSKINDGIKVQINSIICPWRRNRLINLLKNILIIIYIIKIVIIKIIISVWSWKKLVVLLKENSYLVN